MYQGQQGVSSVGCRLHIRHPIAMQNRSRHNDNGPGHKLREEHSGEVIDAHVADKPPGDAGTTIFTDQVGRALLLRFLGRLPEEHVGGNGGPQYSGDHEEELEIEFEMG